MILIELREIQAEDTRELRHRVMWPDKHPDFVILPNDADGLHYGLFEGDRLVSVISLFKEGESAQFRKFATDETVQRNGYGSELLKFMIEEARKLGVKLLFCDARVAAIGFYERFGMSTDWVVFQKNGENYVRMNLDLNTEQ